MALRLWFCKRCSNIQGRDLIQSDYQSLLFHYQNQVALCLQELDLKNNVWALVSNDDEVSLVATREGKMSFRCFTTTATTSKM
jgi:hypothetical protein